ncbi:MAG: hypothetical protein E7363_03625 [Clostridiales bacterium]|nr:hypothetical protein [Clostridiales bacterium]
MDNFKLFLKNNKQLWWLLFIPIYLATFFIVEKVVPTEGYWVSYLPQDDKIPFIEYFIIFYYVWYVLLLGTGLMCIVKEPKVFARYMCTLCIAFMGTMVFSLIFPNGQNLRPTEFARDNVFTDLCKMIYASDTNTNVLPSMHVMGSIACVFACFDSKRCPWWGKTIAILTAALVCASTVFVKQHSILDFYVALPVMLVVGAIVYGKRIYLSMQAKRKQRAEVKAERERILRERKETEQK